MNTVQQWLSTAAGWRYASLLFQLPTPEVQYDLQALVKELPEEFRSLAQELSAIPLDEWKSEYHRVLGPGGCPVCESSYDDNALAGRGPLLAQIAGFYQAFAYRPDEETRETPDHLSVELGFLSYLALKVAYALHEEKAAEREIAEEAYWHFLEAHPLFWLGRVCERIRQSGSVFYNAATNWLGAWTQRQISRAPAAASRMMAVTLKQARRFVVALITIGIMLSLANTTAPAQQSTPASTPAQTAAPKPPPTSQAIKIGSVTFSGSLRARAENWDWFETTAADGNYTFGALLLRLAFSQQKERFDWQLEGAFPLLIALPEDAIAAAPQGQLGLGASYFAANGRQDGSAILKQAFVRFKSLGGDGPSSLRIGRFEFAEGAESSPADATLQMLKRDHIAQRLIGPFGFSHVGRSFDGVQYVRDTKASNFTLVAARPTEGVFQLRSLYELDIDLYYGAFTRQLPGKRASSETRVFAVHYHDGRRVTKTDNRPAAMRQADTEKIRLTTIGSHYLSAIKAGAGTADVLLWGVGQFGDWGELEHRAGAIAIEAGYQFSAKWRPWVRAGYFRSSGDGNPGDGDHTTFFQMLPTPRLYARFPFYNLMNNEDVFVQLRLKPQAKLSLRSEVHHLRLGNENDLWYAGGGAFQKGTFGYLGRPSGGKKSLGTVVDLSVDYNLTQTTSLTLYLSGVRGGEVPANLYPQGGPRPAARFFYFELTQRF